MSSQSDRVRRQDYLGDLDSLSVALKRPSYIAVIRRRLLQPFMLGLSLFLFVLRSLDKFPSRLCKTVYVLVIERVLKVFLLWLPLQLLLTDWAGAACDEARIALKDESYNSLMTLLSSLR
jgi:hypothetical protein